MKSKILILILFFAVPAFSSEITIDFSNARKPIIKVKQPSALQTGKIEVSVAQKFLAVFQVIENKVSTIHLSGNYFTHDSLLCYSPHNSLGEGLEFEVQYYKKTDTIKQRFIIPTSAGVSSLPTVVTKFFPLTNEIPGNILRFHIQFSNPMQNNEMAFMHIKILDENGQEIKMMWRHKSYWINERILVMMIHPGRVKRGITNYNELGPSFTEGKEYTMVVTKALIDANNKLISEEAKRTFKVVADDRKMPAIDFKSIKLPVNNLNDSLKIVFTEGMDYVSVIEGLTVVNKTTDKKISGSIYYTGTDKVWIFKPDNKWQKGEYEIEFTKELTDFASNYLHRPFEITDLKDLNEDKMPLRWKFKIP